MIRQLAAQICAAFIALSLAPAALSQPAPPPDPSTISTTAADNRAVIVSLAKVLRERFAFRERGEAAARAIEAMEQRGEFSGARTAADLLALIDARITPVVNDGHFRVRYLGEELIATFSGGEPTPQQIADYHEEVRLRGGEIPDIRWLDGNVGYLRIRMFLDTPPSTDRLRAAMGLLADTSALIIDVRDAPGGEPAGVAKVIGHLVAQRTPTVHTEDPLDPSASRTFYAEPAEPAYADRPVYLLVNGDTGSGAEEFAYDLQAMGRATLVGQTTSGAATPGGFLLLAGGFAAFIPMQIVTNTVTGANWEGVGVKPDVEVPAEQALDHAHRLALETILKSAQGLRRALAEEAMAAMKTPPG